MSRWRKMGKLLTGFRGDYIIEVEMLIGGGKMIIREYQSADCGEIVELFYNTVHTVNAQDYRKEQLDVWASKNIDIAKWDQSLMAHYAFVALEDGIIVGFGDIDTSGYLDRLYVHKDYQGRGIATDICDKLEAIVREKKIVVHASITAKGFFAKRGYVVIKKQEVERDGIRLINYVMEKEVAKE